MGDPGRVAFYGLNYSPEPTGIGPYTAELAEHLAARGHGVQVVAVHPHYPSWQLRSADRRRRRVATVERGVEVIRLWARVPRRMNGSQRTMFECSYLAAALAEGPGDAAVVVGVVPGLGSGLVAAVHALVRHRRLVIVVQDLIGLGMKQSGMPSLHLLAEVAQRCEGWMVRRADRVIVIAESFVDEVIDHGVPRARITWLPNWARVDIGQDDPRPVAGRPFTVLHAGSMGIKQGLGQVVDAARLAAEAGLDWRFVFAGDGSTRPDLEQQAAGLANVAFVDPVPDAEFAELLASADVLLVAQAPSNVDMSFPSKLTSYFAARRPVVAAVPPDGSVHRFLTETQSGVCAPSGDPERLLEALGAVLGDALLRARVVRLASALLQERWGRAELLERWASWILDDAEPGAGDGVADGSAIA